MKSHILHTVCCNISCEAAGQFEIDHSWEWKGETHIVLPDWILISHSDFNWERSNFLVKSYWVPCLCLGHGVAIYSNSNGFLQVLAKFTLAKECLSAYIFIGIMISRCSRHLENSVYNSPTNIHQFFVPSFIWVMKSKLFIFNVI